MPEKKKVYHGWIVVERGGQHFKDYFFCQVSSDKGLRNDAEFRNPADAIAWWDKKIGKPIRLEVTPLSAYRVYTED